MGRHLPATALPRDRDLLPFTFTPSSPARSSGPAGKQADWQTDMKNKADQVYALLADGTTVEIRPAGPDDFDAVKAMHEAMSPDNAYMRFFNLSRMAGAEEARRTCQEPGPDHGALLALCGGEVVGVASFYVTDKETAHCGRSRSRWPTTCTTGASPPCCSSTWSRSPGAVR